MVTGSPARLRTCCKMGISTQCFMAKAQAGFRVEAVRMDWRWLELICGNKGVPVLSNLSFLGWSAPFD